MAVPSRQHFATGHDFEARFGVEIEMVLIPKFTPSQSALRSDGYWREQLASRLRTEGLKATAKDDAQAYRSQYREYYDRWFITTDSSLQRKDIFEGDTIYCGLYE